MEVLNNLMMGLSVALTPVNLLYLSLIHISEPRD